MSEDEPQAVPEPQNTQESQDSEEAQVLQETEFPQELPVPVAAPASASVPVKKSVWRGPALPILLAIGVVAASAAGTVAIKADDRGGKGASSRPATPPPVRNAAWVVNGAHDAPTLSSLTGFWIGADVVVRGGVDGLHAVKRADGAPAWDLPTPGGGDLCGMSAGVDGGIGLVAAQGTPEARGSGANADCSVVSAVDTATGKVLWTTPIAATFGDPDAGAADYAAAGGVAVVDSDRDTATTGVVGLDLRTGTTKWKHPGDCEHRAAAFAVTGTKLALAEVCQDKPTVRLLDVATGEPVPNAAVPTAGLQPHPAILAADPLVVSDSATNPRMLSFGGGAADPVADQGDLFSALNGTSAVRAQISLAAGAGGMLCGGGRSVTCWVADGRALVPRGLPNAAAEHHDVYAVLGTGGAARVVTTGVPGHPRASLCRITADGDTVVEADLAQPVSDYLGRNGIAGSYLVYGDAKDLFLLDPHPDGKAAMIDVRLG